MLANNNGQAFIMMILNNNRHVNHYIYQYF